MRLHVRAITTRKMNKPNGIITFTSDFSTSDGFVGAVKGKILSHFPGAKIVDISHDIPPGDIAAAAWCLMASTGFFPAGTVHLAVIDPGVGSSRLPVIIEGAGGHFFVGPDNGIFHLALRQAGTARAWTIDGEAVTAGEPPSSTFHGRDIFAPAAAMVAAGRAVKRFAGKMDIKDLCVPDIDFSCVAEGKNIFARVVHIDRFGNIITSIPDEYLARIGGGRMKKRTVGKPVECYERIARGKLDFIGGSCGLVEISAGGASAARLARACIGDRVTAVLTK